MLSRWMIYVPAAAELSAASSSPVTISREPRKDDLEIWKCVQRVNGKMTKGVAKERSPLTNGHFLEFVRLRDVPPGDVEEFLNPHVFNDFRGFTHQDSVRS